MNVQILSLSRENKDFYRLMGPFFGSRSAAKEIGIHIYDDEDKEWFTAYDGFVLIGFASLRRSVVSDCYVRPTWRGEGVFSAILSRILLAVPAGLKANCTPASLGVFVAKGFTVASSTKNFTRVEN
jgi:GNAT superfamily N-acetyltransferase